MRGARAARARRVRRAVPGLFTFCIRILNVKKQPAPFFF
jgi:hypothetical protein